MNRDSLDKFREWFERQEIALPTDKLVIVGKTTMVESRLGLERLVEWLTQCNPSLKDIKKIAENFKNNGGKLIETRDVDVIIEIDKIQVKLPLRYIKEQSSES